MHFFSQNVVLFGKRMYNNNATRGGFLVITLPTVGTDKYHLFRLKARFSLSFCRVYEDAPR